MSLIETGAAAPLRHPREVAQPRRLPRPEPHILAQGALTGTEAMIRRGLVLMLFASIFLQRFSIPFTEVALALLVTVGVLGWFGLSGLLRVDLARFAAFCVLAAACLLSKAVNWIDISMTSLPLLLLIYALYVFRLEMRERLFLSVLDAFLTMVAVCAVCGIVQFLAQFAIGGEGMLFSWYGILPDWLLSDGFNTKNPLSLEGPIYKANGLFLIEPSTFSQYLSLAAIFELVFFGATRRFYLYLLALPFSYSGTGMIVLFALLPLALVAQQRWKTIGGLALFLVVAAATGSLWQADALVGRVSEFGTENTSATARFIAGAWLIRDLQLGDWTDMLFGMGPGAFSYYLRFVPYEAHDPPWVKMTFEYGLFGFAALLLYGTVCLAQARSGWIVAALAIGFFAFGGTLLETRYQVLILVLCTLTAAAPQMGRLQRGVRP